MSYERTYVYLRHYLIASFLTTLLIASILAPQIQLADAGGKSPYDSGYDHGCDDADISDPSARYINEPGKGASFHTDEFMQGYNAGYNDCSDDDNTNSDGSQSSRPDWGANSDGSEICPPINGYANLDCLKPETREKYEDAFYNNEPLPKLGPGD
jgi:hypothetical protein